MTNREHDSIVDYLEMCRLLKDRVDELERTNSEVSAAVAGERDVWRSIETAPKSGVPVLLYQPFKCGYPSIFIGHYANGWVSQHITEDGDYIDMHPTLWTPLPHHPPSARSNSAAGQTETP